MNHTDNTFHYLIYIINYRFKYDVLTVDLLLYVMFHCRQSASDHKKALAKARLKKFREVYNSPELLEEYRRKERERLGVR